MAETDKLLRTVLVVQAEILGRLSRIEKTIGVNDNPEIDPRFEALAELESLMETDLGTGLSSNIQDLIDTVSGAR